MLSIEAMKKLRAAYDPYAPVAEAEALQEIGAPTGDEIVATALAGLDSEDRNIRVLMLRILKAQSGQNAMRGILAGLNDDQRRVREVAIKCSSNFLQYPEITERLAGIATDETETRKIRGHALNGLAGHTEGPSVGALPKAAAEALETLAKADKFRSNVLFGLLQIDLSDQVEDLLKEFVKSGTKEEAVMATKALCGYQVVNLGAFPNEAVRKKVTQTCERAAGRVFYWVKRTELDALKGNA